MLDVIYGRPLNCENNHEYLYCVSFQLSDTLSGEVYKTMIDNLFKRKNLNLNIIGNWDSFFNQVKSYWLFLSMEVLVWIFWETLPATSRDPSQRCVWLPRLKNCSFTKHDCEVVNNVFKSNFESQCTTPDTMFVQVW